MNTAESGIYGDRGPTEAQAAFVMRLKLALAASSLIVLGAACSSAENRATGTLTRPIHPSPSTTTHHRPFAARLSASSEPWKLAAPVSRSVVLPSRSGFEVLGGLSIDDASTSRIVEVDPASGNSRIAGHLAVAVHDGAGAVIGRRDFVFGGGSVGSTAIVQASTAGSAAEVASLPEDRSDLALATLDGTTYIVGGYDGSAMTPAVLATRDGVSFRPIATLAIPVRYAAVAGLGSALWVIGGAISTTEGGSACTDAVQKVDLTSGRATVTGRLPEPMGHATALLLDGQIFVLGGRSKAAPSAAIFRLDAATGALVPAGRLPEAVSDAGSVVVRGVGYLVGGELAGAVGPTDEVVALRPILSQGS